MNVKIITNKDEYLNYSEFIINNIPKISSNFFVKTLNNDFKPFDEVLKNNFNYAKEIFWHIINQEELQAYLFSEGTELTGFAIMEKKKYLRYLYVSEDFQGQQFGSKILFYLKRKFGDYSLKVEAKKCIGNDALNRFYEKNRFKKTSTSSFNGIDYIEYSY